MIEHGEARKHAEIKDRTIDGLTDEKFAVAVEHAIEKYGLPSEEARVLCDYLPRLDISLDELGGKRILDVGSAEGYFGKALAKIDPTIEVVDFDDGRSVFKDKMDVMGRAEAMPFADGTFDLVLAHCSTPVMDARTGRMRIVPEIISEMIRVARVGGVVKIYPIGGADPDYSPDIATNSRAMEVLIMQKVLAMHLRVEVLKIIDPGDPANWRKSLIIYK